MTASGEDLVRRLCAFGLAEAEATVYFHLSRLQRAKAAEVAQAAGRRRPDIYPVLERLGDKGFVEQTIDRPAVYVPVPLDQALQHWLERDRLRARQLAKEADELKEVWPRTRHDIPQPDDRLSVHQGVQQVTAILESRIRAAKYEVLVVMTPPLLQRLDPLQEYLAASSDATTVRMLTEVDSLQDSHAFEPLQGCRIRHLDLPEHLQMILIDSHEALVFVSAGRSESVRGTEETLLHIHASDVVLALEAIFDRLWCSGTELALRIEEIRSDRPASRVVRVRGRWIRYTRMREMVGAAQRSVLLSACAEEADRWQQAGLLDLLRDRRGNGVEVQVFLHGEPESLPELREAASAVVQLADRPHAAIVAVDGVQALCVPGCHDAGGLTNGEEWSVWATEPDLVRFLLESVPAVQVPLEPTVS